ncbi:MAG TPA: LysR family transcriptional regulator [Pararobbsia sp.]|jgi:DNA-binding transcriptional LysR family regulator|nr:LysR family transcriptional regulator [Pararobbsia sp.]
MLEELKSFIAVIDEASLTRAADALCVSQSAVSKRIQRLEALLGTDLFDRNSKPPRPNSFASRVYEEAVPLLGAMERLLNLAREDATPSGTFRFGLPQIVADIALVDAVMSLKAGFPALDLRLHTDWSASLQQMIEAGALDSAVLMLPKGTTPHEGLSARHVSVLEVLVVQSKRKPLVKPRTTIKALATQDWVLNPLGCGYRAALERAIDRKGQRLRLSVDTHGAGTQLQLVSAGVGLGLVPKGVLARSDMKKDLQVVDVSDFKLSVDLWLVHPRQTGNLKPAIDLISDSVVASFERYSS